MTKRYGEWEKLQRQVRFLLDPHSIWEEEQSEARRKRLEHDIAVRIAADNRNAFAQAVDWLLWMGEMTRWEFMTPEAQQEAIDG